MNGIDAIQFDFQTGLEVADSSSMKIGTGDYALVFVAKVQPGSMSGTVMWGKDDLSVGFGAGPATLSVTASPANASVALPSTIKFALYAVRGVTLRLEADGNTATGSASTADLTPNASAWRMLPQTTGNLASVEVAEVIFIKGTLSDANLGNVKSYLTAKYAL